MKNKTRMLLLSLAAMFLASCATTPPAPVVNTNYDKSADFSGYHSFGFFAPLGTDSAGLDPVVTQTLKNATRAQMESRGYVYAESGADLLINFNAKLSQQLQVQAAPAQSSQVYFSYRRGYYTDWSGSDNALEVTQYKEGTVNIDMVDAKSKKLVWEGVAVGRVTDQSSRNREAVLTSVVADILSEYPFRPGG